MVDEFERSERFVWMTIGGAVVGIILAACWFG
jgi:hypothetical protein